MANFVRDYLVRLGFDGSAADTGAKKTQGSFTELNQALELASKGVALIQGAYTQLDAAMARATAVEGVTKGFENLQAAAGLLASDSLVKLQTATKGLVDDFTLMQQANQAVQLGLDPTQLDVMAEAAVKLGAAVGRTGEEAFGDLITGVGRASPLILDNLGITIKAAEAQQIYADKLGKSTDQLTENEKAQAFRVAALEKIAQKSESLADVEINAAQAFTQLQVSMSNAWDQVVTGISSNEDLAEAFSSLAETISEVDIGPLVDDIAKLISVVVSAIDYFGKLINIINETFYAAEIQAGHVDKATDALIKNARSTEQLFAVLESLEGQLAEVNDELKAEEEFLNSTMAAEHADYSASHDLAIKKEQLQKSIVKVKDAALLFNDEVEETPGKLDNVGGAAGDAKDEVEKLTTEWAKLTNGLKTSDLESSMQYAIDNLDQASFGELLVKIRDNTESGLREAFKKFKGIIPDADIDEAIADETGKAVQKWVQQMGSKTQEVADDVESKLKDAHKASVDFWADTFQNAITGTTFDLEDALKQVAVGFAAEMAAGLSGGFSFEGGPQGLGGALFDSLFGDLITVAGGSGGASGGAGVAETVAGGAAGAVAGAATLTTTIASAAVAAFPLIAAGVGAFHLQNFQNAFDQDTPEAQGFGAVTAGIDTIFPGVGTILNATLGGLFGGSSDPDSIARGSFFDWLKENTGLGEDLTFAGVGGDISLGDFDYNTGTGGELEGQSIGLVSGIAAALTGGGKLGEDFTSIFAQAVSQAETFNEAIVNTLSLMDTIGISAEEAKAGVVEAFFEGGLSLEEYGVALQNLNLLQQENLEGVGNMGAAFDILNKSIAEDPKTALKAMELAFREAAEVSENQLEAVSNELAQRFGVDAPEIMSRLQSIGITTWEDIRNANADQIYAILSLINDLGFGIETELSGASSTASSNMKSSFSTASTEIQTILNTMATDSKSNMEGTFDAFRSDFVTDMDSTAGDAATKFNEGIGDVQRALENFRTDLGTTVGKAEDLKKAIEKIPSDKTVTIHYTEAGRDKLNR